MRGEPRAVDARLSPAFRRGRRSSWRTTLRRGRRAAAKAQRVEVIARLAEQERRARRAGEYISEPGRKRPWC
ncbi:MAG: hypothetical protein JO168_20385 [Solirubrobacterales bacterium]|nr:hypothetical protein [Solirubrobacterales bacterium]MBV9715166.1 hypothetical protein [Solirubrobacterales bacterium]